MPENPLPSVIFLDIGNVLLTNGWDHDLRCQTAKKFGLEIDQLNERHHLTYDTYEEGKLSLDSYLDRVVFYKERPFTKDALIQYIFDQTRAFPQTIQLMHELKQRFKLRIGAVSNEGRELMQYRIETFNLEAFIDFFIGSCFVHIRKPDFDIYRLALDVAQVDPHNVVYIDDRAMFVEVASSLEIRGIVHKDHAATKKALAEMGLTLEG
jgi:putative hydrolase of the HAD superfamily